MWHWCLRLNGEKICLCGGSILYSTDTDSVLGWHLYALQLVFIGESFMIFHQQPLLSLISCTICNCNTVDVLNKAHDGSNRAEGCNFLVIHILRSWRPWGDLLELQSQFTDYLKRRHRERVFSDQNHLREQSRAAEWLGIKCMFTVTANLQSSKGKWLLRPRKSLWNEALN